jgi:F-type H+-transporting ATPase subunit alpha
MQIKAMRQVAVLSAPDLAQSSANWRPLRNSVPDLDKATLAQLARGQRLTEILQQDQYAPYP